MIYKKDEIQHNRAMVFGHHAYLAREDLHEVDKCERIVTSLGFDEVNYVMDETFGIDEARKLIKTAYIKPNVSEKKLIVVKVKTLTLEAQQSLLKILEEPPATTVFLFLVDKGIKILPTLQSRFQEYRLDEKKEKPKENVTFVDFCKLSYADRLATISKKLEKPDSVWLNEISDGLALESLDNIQKMKPKVLTTLNMIIMNLNTRGASNKMLLEEMALTIPLQASK